MSSSIKHHSVGYYVAHTFISINVDYSNFNHILLQYLILRLIYSLPDSDCLSDRLIAKYLSVAFTVLASYDSQFGCQLIYTVHICLHNHLYLTTQIAIPKGKDFSQKIYVNFTGHWFCKFGQDT